MQRLCLGVVLGLMGLPLAYADTDAPLVDVYMGAYSWDAEMSGGIASGGNQADVQDDLGFERSRQNVFYVGFEHPVPVLPNVRVKMSDLSDSADGTVSDDFEFRGFTFTASQDVESSYQLDYQDLTLYYTPLDLGFKVDVGLNVRFLDAEVEIRESGPGGNREQESAEVTVPMVHLAARGNLPLTGVYALGEVNAVSYGDNRLSDIRAGLGWRSDFLLGVEVGYSQIDFRLEDFDDLEADLEFGGPYMALSLAF